MRASHSVQERYNFSRCDRIENLNEVQRGLPLTSFANLRYMILKSLLFAAASAFLNSAIKFLGVCRHNPTVFFG